jgi:hypothetical protein
MNDKLSLIDGLRQILPALNRAYRSVDPQLSLHPDLAAPPQGWAPFMAWPPGDVGQHYAQADAQKRKKILEGLQRMAEEQEKRARATRDWLVSIGAVEPQGNQVMSGIMWASLLAPEGVPAAMGQIVAKWNFDTLTTKDGGELHATRNELRLRRGSQEAVQALVLEAKLRGWSSLEIQGSPAFKKQVVAEASKYGIPVKTRDRTGKVVLLSTAQPVLGPEAKAEKPSPSGPAPTSPGPKAPQGTKSNSPAGPAQPPSSVPADGTVVQLSDHRNAVRRGGPEQSGSEGPGVA